MFSSIVLLVTACIAAVVHAQTPPGYTPNTTVPLYLKYDNYPVVAAGSVLPYNRECLHCLQSIQKLPIALKMLLTCIPRDCRAFVRACSVCLQTSKRHLHPLHRRRRQQQICTHTRQTAIPRLWSPVLNVFTRPNLPISRGIPCYNCKLVTGPLLGAFCAW